MPELVNPRRVADHWKERPMNRPRNILVGMLLALSLLGVGAVAQAQAAPPASPTVTADRWCC
jgi:hypothetical protein